MPGKKRLDITNAEFEVLSVIWKNGRQSVREIHDQLRDSRGWALTTVRTMLDRMEKKGLVKKADYHGIFLFSARISRPAGLAKLVRFFGRQVFETDPENLVAMFASSKGLKKSELAELKALLEEDED